jgi:hypothetical protein
MSLHFIYLTEITRIDLRFDLIHWYLFIILVNINVYIKIMSLC